ncbi:hypothetical protein Ari01nite_94630 [Paractinoplanes rishiriensis]|uniref:Uncharacterized protein n=1 Tax=Paractinoplanes rishiriensis TaxID=1050105 RepID=A0A919K8I1_9ACTN|nr:hypothetical protein Ari01nite_94630 [Actinoplanes rishiriensis]
MAQGLDIAVVEQAVRVGAVVGVPDSGWGVTLGFVEHADHIPGNRSVLSRARVPPCAAPAEGQLVLRAGFDGAGVRPGTRVTFYFAWLAGSRWPVGPVVAGAFAAAVRSVGRWEG